jgi:hypothetical protein
LIVLEKIAQWEKLKALVLDGVSSPIKKWMYPSAEKNREDCAITRALLPCP